ncbi:MAG: 3-hydroxyacyl-CoA dehydrogenase [Desulfuromonadaceae bacterium]|nr:3-hydroxyacyl-CoA dehydrogenase [Desulfuromonadaceae bacterium]
MRISTSTFIVTGAGSGLGAATARSIIAAGGNVVIADVNKDAGEKIAAELGVRARFVQTDVTSEESAVACVAAAVETFGGLHGLVNCAGVAPGEKVVGKEGPHKLESFVRCISINLIGTFNMIRLAAEVMLKNEPNENGERGIIINTASISAFEGQVGQAAYSASKGGIVGLTLPVAREFAPKGIRIMAIAPGVFDTAMMAAMTDTIRESLAQMIPFPSRFGKPAEYASLACHIIENVMLNGEVIRIDGAIRMGAR